jgi:hypothetical protein
MTFDLNAYALLAEKKALEIKAKKEKKAAMDAEAAKLTVDLNNALFQPYVGRTVGLCYGGRSPLVRGVPDSIVKAEGLVPEKINTSVDTRGWFALVYWDDVQERMEASVRQVDRSLMYGKEVVLKGGALSDIGTQAVELGRQFAELIAKRLVVE